MHNFGMKAAVGGRSDAVQTQIYHPFIQVWKIYSENRTHLCQQIVEGACVQLSFSHIPGLVDGLRCYWFLFIAVCVCRQAVNEAVYQFGYTLCCSLLYLINVFKLCSNDCWFLATPRYVAMSSLYKLDIHGSFL